MAARKNHVVAVGSGDELRLRIITHYGMKNASVAALDRYRDYIKSPHWQARKELYYQTHPKQCAVCFSVAATVDLNHAFYGDLGQERDEDLIPFCRDHHQGFHDRYGVKFNMREECRAYIYEEQQKLFHLKLQPLSEEQKPAPGYDLDQVVALLAQPGWWLLSFLGIRPPR